MQKAVHDFWGEMQVPARVGPLDSCCSIDAGRERTEVVDARITVAERKLKWWFAVQVLCPAHGRGTRNSFPNQSSCYEPPKPVGFRQWYRLGGTARFPETAVTRSACDVSRDDFPQSGTYSVRGTMASPPTTTNFLRQTITDLSDREHARHAAAWSATNPWQWKRASCAGLQAPRQRAEGMEEARLRDYAAVDPRDDQV